MGTSGTKIPDREPIDGFPRVAYTINSIDNDKTATIYRRFDRLSARNLLLMEAEIAELEALLDRYDNEDLQRRYDHKVMNSHADWAHFEQLAGAKTNTDEYTNPDQAKRMALCLKIRGKLKEYHGALRLHQELLNSRPPAETTVRLMKRWFHGEDTPHKTPQLWGESSKRFDDAHDLVALRVPEDQDQLSRSIMKYFGFLFKAQQQQQGSPPSSSGPGQPPRAAPHSIRESAVARAAAVLNAALAALLLLGSILSLDWVVSGRRRLPARLLGLVALWTALFALYVGFLTSARRDQVFAATAAYAAVLVVFVSGPVGGGAACGT
ncbi:hypothetical protein F4780DRAFT_298916 [Xylariomycetidae sp. FL0641]|nr:hypothetical protein F4780DRAFT_298916 [Xylariomycetidae sp. FL0641]